MNIKLSAILIYIEALYCIFLQLPKDLNLYQGALHTHEKSTNALLINWQPNTNSKVWEIFQCSLTGKLPFNNILFYFDWRKTKKGANVQAINSHRNKKKKRFAEVSDPENKKLVDNSVQGNTQKSTKKVSALTLRNTKIVAYISQLPLKFRLSSNCSFFGKSSSLGIILWYHTSCRKELTSY